MAFEIFGYEISKKKDKAPQAAVVTPVTPRDDGASIVYSSDSGSYGAAAGYYGYQFDLDGVVRNESQMINQYRTVACFPEVDGAIEAIVNDAVIIEQGRDPVSLNLDGLPKQYHPLRDTIREHFDHVLNVLNFNDNCHDIFKRWYIDGRLYYYVMIDPKNPKKGIVDLKYIDPRKIRKVIEYQRENRNGIDVIVGQKSYYIFNDAGLQSAALGVKLSTDSIINVRSGLVDANTGEVISHLFKGIKPANQLKMMEDALVIYRITRAPERRVFYVDVGNLPGLKAEQYVNNVMNKFRNKVVYDAETGEVKNNRNYMSVCEDFFLPRREGGKATEIQTLPGCLSMDTKVSLLDGRELSIREIENEIDGGKQLWTYSCHPETGKVVPGLITWAGVTQKSAKVMKLTLDNGETITCTPDHKFPIKDVGFVRADQLKVNDSLIPLYRRTQYIAKHKPNRTYEQVYDNETHEWQFTHRLVSNYIDTNCDIKHPVIHHADFNRFNNDPTNLVKMTWDDHVRVHNENNTLQKYWQDVKDRGEWEHVRAKHAEMTHQKWLALDEEERIRRISQLRSSCHEYWDSLSPEQYQQRCKNISDNINKYLASLTDEQREQRAAYCRINVAKAKRASLIALQDPIKQAQRVEKVKQWWDLDDHRQVRSAQNKERYANMDPSKREALRLQNVAIHEEQQMLVIDDYIAKFVVDLCKNKTTHQMKASDIVAILNSNDEIVDRFRMLNNGKKTANWDGWFTVNNLKNLMCRYYGFETWKRFRHNAKYLNHRIVAIQWLDDPIEVGTLTIDIDEIYHNYHTFALSCGVFTKNSQNLSEIADIEYFQKKLYQSLNVPRQRLLNDNVMSIGNPNEVTREELAFAKFIQRLRNRFNVLFKEALRIQLITTNCIRQSDWEKIRNCIYFEYQHDNYFEELKRIEVFNERMTQLQTADGFKGIYFSKEYIVRNILEMTQEEWEEIQQQMKQEKIDEAREAAELENANAGDQEGDDQFDQDSSEGEGDDGYNDFVSGNDSAPEEVDQEGDTTDTIDDTAEPNPGEDDFDRPATPGLKATM
nr:MAG TPA: capsid assembly protein [Caudoviricetes sp.]